MTELNPGCAVQSLSDEIVPEHVPKVRFPVEQTLQHDSEIVIESAGNGTYDVHLGFLQICHKYEIKFSIKDDAGQDLTFDPLQNLNVAIMEVVPSDDGEGHDLRVEFKANKEKLVKEEITLSSVTDKRLITVIFHTRVLGKGKGTPALRRGIKCVGIEDEDDESDFTGFD